MDGFSIWFLSKGFSLVQTESKRTPLVLSVKFVCEFTCKVPAILGHHTICYLVMCDLMMMKYNDGPNQYETCQAQ